MSKCIEETGRELTLNNQDIVKYLCGIEDERNNLENIIQKQYQERKRIEAEIEKLTYKLCLINKSLSMRIKAKNNYDRTIEEIRTHYEKLVDSSNRLKQIVEKTQQDLDDIMNKKIGTGTGPDGDEIRMLYVKPNENPGPDDCPCAYIAETPTREYAAAPAQVGGTPSSSGLSDQSAPEFNKNYRPSEDTDQFGTNNSVYRNKSRSNEELPPLFPNLADTNHQEKDHLLTSYPEKNHSETDHQENNGSKSNGVPIKTSAKELCTDPVGNKVRISEEEMEMRTVDAQNDPKELSLEHEPNEYTNIIEDITTTLPPSHNERQAGSFDKPGGPLPDIPKEQTDKPSTNLLLSRLRASRSPGSSAVSKSGNFSIVYGNKKGASLASNSKDRPNTRQSPETVDERGAVSKSGNSSIVYGNKKGASLASNSKDRPNTRQSPETVDERSISDVLKTTTGLR